MTRTLALLSLLAAAAAVDSPEELETSDLVKPVRIVEQSNCLLDGSEIVNDAADAAMFIWAAYARCGKGAQSSVKCEIGVSSAIQSVDGMMIILIKALRTCGDVHTENQACGLAAAGMTKRFAGLSAYAGSVAQQCTPAGGPDGSAFPLADPVFCAVDIKNTLKNLFKLVKAFLQTNRNCNPETQKTDPDRCATNALKIIGGFAGIGQFLAGSIGRCSPDPSAFQGSRCAQASIGLAQHLTMLSKEGVELARKCNREDAVVEKAPISTVPPVGKELVDEEIAEEPGRLYSQDGIVRETTSFNTNGLLLAFLPVTAIVGFVGGRMYSARRGARTTQVLDVRETMSDIDMNIE